MIRSFIAKVFEKTATQRGIRLVSATRGRIMDVWSNDSTGCFTVVLEHGNKQESFVVYLFDGITPDVGMVIEFLVNEVLCGLQYFDDVQSGWKEDSVERVSKIREYLDTLESKLVGLLTADVLADFIQLFYKLEDISTDYLPENVLNDKHNNSVIAVSVAL